MPAENEMTAGATWLPAVDQGCVFGCYSVVYSIVIQLFRSRGGSGGRRLSKGEAPGRIGLDGPIRGLAVILRPSGEERCPTMRHDPRVLA
jgi:hypothetical protein